jgi:cell wall-associated NlpC family hydrolase
MGADRMRRAAAVLASGVLLGASWLAAAPGAAHASTSAPRSAAVLTVAHRAPDPLSALRWAEAQAGHPYVWAGTGPGFDCSGLVMMAYLRADGVRLPHNTVQMLDSGMLIAVPARDRQRGMLAFYGSGHVELVTEHGTFGALEPGTLVGWHVPNAWWHPTMYFRVR